MNKTLDYYNVNAKNFIETTQKVIFSETQDTFLSCIPDSATILDFGCGSGRDTAYFLEKGYKVDAVDGSYEMCKAASQYTGIDVKQMLFAELNADGIYDGIWACSSVLHLPKNELKEVLSRMEKALKTKGVIYMSFKYGTFEGERNGRYFTDFTEGSFQDFLRSFPRLEIDRLWITGDVRPGREAEKWLNVLLNKKRLKEKG